MQPKELKHTAIIIIDADNLKYVNDKFGHIEGDRYLNALANILVQYSGNNSICARLGGDEFAILIYGLPSKEKLELQLQQLLDNNDKHTLQLTNNDSILISFSMGYALYPENGQDLGTLMRIADEKMYETKRNRKEKKI